MNYPNPSDTVEILITAARRAAMENNVHHPEDIASAMLSAIEYSWPVILECHTKFTKE